LLTKTFTLRRNFGNFLLFPASYEKQKSMKLVIQKLEENQSGGKIKAYHLKD